MELKYGREEQHSYAYQGSNRTFMELKWERTKNLPNIVAF